ncbi:hypothetical protein OH76DRAFT_506023 [Lentinus brumalis]|uniref:Uncharacterized protein n=1 Tax=Lentinus brumalis TaxID=2498619 RepID=A0A371CHW2_9APHY|nr:hypothetical protein OH76DRAFT_506023 [Polyporus brumalis]
MPARPDYRAAVPYGLGAVQTSQTAWFSQDNRPDSWSKRSGLSHIPVARCSASLGTYCMDWLHSIPATSGNTGFMSLSTQTQDIASARRHHSIWYGVKSMIQRAAQVVRAKVLQILTSVKVSIRIQETLLSPASLADATPHLGTLKTRRLRFRCQPTGQTVTLHVRPRGLRQLRLRVWVTDAQLAWSIRRGRRP